MSSGHIVGFANGQQRKDQRRAVNDTFVVIGGDTCKVVNISLRSVLCVGYKGAAKADDEIIIEDLLMADDSRVKVNLSAKVIRVDETKKELVAVFLDMNSKTFDTLEKMMMLRPVTSKGGRLK